MKINLVSHLYQEAPGTHRIQGQQNPCETLHQTYVRGHSLHHQVYERISCKQGLWYQGHTYAHNGQVKVVTDKIKFPSAMQA